jgi:YHS domain-containing protein
MQKLFVLSILTIFFFVGSVSAQSKEKNTEKAKDKKECTTKAPSDKTCSSDKASKTECSTEKKPKSEAKSCCSHDKSEVKAEKSDDHCKSEGHSESKASSEEYKSFNSVCPVSGMGVKASVKTVSYESKDYGFCCPGCGEKFSANPEKYSKYLSEDGSSLLKN